MANNNLPALRVMSPPTAMPTEQPRLPSQFDTTLVFEQARQQAITDLHLLGMSQVTITHQVALLQSLEAIHRAQMLTQAYQLSEEEDKDAIAELVRGELVALKHLADRHAGSVMVTIEQSVRELSSQPRQRGFWEGLWDGLLEG